MAQNDANAQVRELLPAFLHEVRAARRIVLGTHLNPDGDALGSALGLAHILRSMELEVEVLCHHPVPKSLQFLPGASKVRQEPKRGDMDLVIVLDLEALDRLGSLRPAFESAPRMVVIDHHVPHEQPGDLRIVDTSAPATASILCDLFLDSGLEITADAADCLLTGIVTDTGGFRYANSTPHTLYQAGRLIELGANLARVSQEVYMRRPESSLRILGVAIAKMNLSHKGRLAWVSLTGEEMAKFNATDEHTEGIVNELLSIDTVEIAAFFREGKMGKHKGSLRSLGSHDVAAVARQFGGGGHKNAAGLNSEGSRDEVESAVISALGQLLK
jgi:bifunctional oligoribonuclease and PAP phosphatase NrnA